MSTMVPPLKDETTTPVILDTENHETICTLTPTTDFHISFSHVQLYVDHVEDLHIYKDIEDALNHFHAAAGDLSCSEQQKLWEVLSSGFSEKPSSFVSQNRDVIKQLMVGFGFRVTGYRYPELGKNAANTKSLLVTSRDLAGVQIVVTTDASNDNLDDYQHFDAGK